jgi:HlyD family secretion protein
VIRLNIEEGETAVVGTMNNAGSLLLTIGDLSAIEAVMVVDETDVPMISIGDSAVVELDAFSGQLFAARVSTIGNSSIQSGSGTSPQGSVTFEVILTLLERPENLRPSLSATADIIVEQRKGVISAPIISVILEPETASPAAAPASVNEAEASVPGPAARPTERRSEGVFVVRDGRAVWTPVTLGITGQEYFEVRSGLSIGDQVVAGPYQTIRVLRDGDAVQITNESSEPL